MKSRGAVLLTTALFACLGGCGSTPRGAPSNVAATKAADGAPTGSATEIELVESFPVETSLDHGDVRDASVVWPEMIERAKRTLDFSEFYASDVEGAADPAKSPLAPTLTAIGRAVKRGVRVRFLADKRFASTYAATLDRLRGAGATVKTIDCGPRYGGVQHAKYFVVDDAESFVGSQNFDWRALEHIQEMGVRVRSSAVATGLRDVFEVDWTLADPQASSTIAAHARPETPDDTAKSGETITLEASPKGWLPDDGRWDLDRIVAIIDGARSSVDVQVLTYSTQNRDKSAFVVLDEALRRAADRGVKVRLLVSHWGAKPNTAERRSIEALASRPNIAVRVLTIPPWSGGEIPFARVSHAKYMVADGRTAWIGTSNWEGDYFLRTRNVAIVAEGGLLGPRLDKIFDDGWSSAYASPLAQ